MRFHDFHLDGYTVADKGRHIVMHLAYDYPGIAREESNIEFRGVALYHFVHPAGAIITDIEETTPEDIVTELGETVTEWARLYGVNGWKVDRNQYGRWLLDSPSPGENRSPNGPASRRTCADCGCAGARLRRE